MIFKGNENWFELAEGSSYRGFELPGVDCIKMWEGRLASYKILLKVAIISYCLYM